MKEFPHKPLKLGVLGSGRGSNFIAIADAIASNRLHAEIVLVASDFANAPILTEARQRNLPVYACPQSAYKTKLEPEIETALAHELQKAGAVLVVLAGFMRVIKAPLLSAFPNKIINIHPSLLPAFPGLRAWEQALQAGAKETGCTVHWVNDQIDAGQIIAQATVPVLPTDTAETLHARIQKAEHQLFPNVLEKMFRLASKVNDTEGGLEISST